MPRTLLLSVPVALAIVSSPSRASAQAIDLAAGYSLLTYGSTCVSECAIPAGWLGSLGVKVTSTLAVVADVSGAYKSFAAGASFSEHAYLFGPRLQWTRSSSPIGVFGQLTFGGITGRIAAGTGSDSSTVFTFAPGLGVDVKLDDHWAVRGGVNFRFLEPPGGGDWFRETQVIAGVSYAAR